MMRVGSVPEVPGHFTGMSAAGIPPCCRVRLPWHIREVLFSAQIPEHLAAIRMIRRAEGIRKVSFLLRDLQMEHDDSKQ